MKKSADSPIPLGRVSGLFGVRGWVKIHSDTSPRENILTYKEWILIQNGVEQVYSIQQGQRQGKGVVVHLEGFADRTEAEVLIGAEIFIRPDQLKPLASDEYYWSELIGCQVSNRQQESLGEVDSLMETGANDVMIVKLQGKEQLIPFIDPWLIEVDIENQSIIVDWESDF
ncbi:MAG: ribosome maturation factor RimM [Gammaproteobacteria bacterium]|jgi:16S rRNA processing protein RimM|nr:ribosome maturation factor RimM [Gammaproteobacteria bacterium]MBT4606652.1 ribosome maturation factor RimM [Thiotrichales bacterium]MBT3471633.1 ribosome maturation factor RimM [Gammaproteobacteria bacterium]MBT3966100.1 ribosome maturation factor RimM [Gammaproteobacteria bacterium]MBT4079807.1 ribosome maturation factor RimM [Gammaproteobacteria bacterium]